MKHFLDQLADSVEFEICRAIPSAFPEDLTEEDAAQRGLEVADRFGLKRTRHRSIEFAVRVWRERLAAKRAGRASTL